MKVLLIGNDKSVKGGITSVINQLNQFDWKKDGIILKILPSYIESNVVFMIFFFLFSCIKLVNHLIFFKPDVVHIHMSYRGSFIRKQFMFRIIKLFHVPVLIHLHGSEFKKWYDSTDSKKQEKIRLFLREINAMIVLGNEWNDSIKAIEPKTNTIVLSNSIKVVDHQAAWQDEKFRCLYLGVLIERKGVSDLLHAVSLIHDTMIQHNVELIIAGTGNQEQELHQLAKDLKLTDVVTFAGWCDKEKKEQLLMTSQLLVLPSYNEGLPIAILEACSYGLAIVASDVGDVKQVVQDDQNGYLITPGDINEIARSLEKCFIHKEKWELMSTNSKKVIEENFDEKVYYEKLKKIFEVLKNKKTGV